jgi:YidC/Oxa1 family membrane protein insertase
MPDFSNNPNQPRKPKKDLTMEVRLIIAFVLMGIVLFVSPLFFKTPPTPPRPQTPPTVNPAPNPEEPKKPDAPKPDAPQQAATTDHEFIGPQAPPSTITVETRLYVVKLSNAGGVVTSWVLKDFKDSEGKRLELVNLTALDAKKPAPFSIMYQDGKDAEQLNSALFTPAKTEDNDGTTVSFMYAAGRTQCTKTFHFRKNSYLSSVTSEVRQNDLGVPHLLEWRGGFGDFKVLNRQAVEQSVYFDLANNKLLLHGAGSPADERGLYSFAGLQDTFFAVLMLPPPELNSAIQVRSFKDDVVLQKDAAAEPYVGVAVGGGEKNEFSVFVGPKNVDILKNVDPKHNRLSQLIDWGWFWFLAKPLFATLHWLNDKVLHSYGWSIVVVTIVINILLLPLRFKSMKSAKKMQALAPQIKTINAKYKDVGMRDPRKAEQNKEVMELYKKNGVNPMGGCLPMLVQLPILYAFYKVLNVTVELRGAPWLWVADLSQPEQLPIHVLPIVMIITQFMMQKMTPSPSADASQAKMMRFMPLLFGFFFYNMSSGLVLYWLTGNLVGIAQQWLMNKRTPAVEIIPAPKLGPGKKNR